MHSNVCLVVISKNESKRIHRCLGSAKPLVGKMLVLDTGSTDGTVAIARAMGAEVHHFDWCNDFSVARNRALTLADADWNLVMDADEWLGEGELNPGSALSFIGLIKLHNLDESTGEQLSSVSWLPRLLPRGVRYEGIIHEQPISDLPRQRLNLDVFHDGYSRTNTAVKKGRNKSLLLQALKFNPDDPYIRYQLGVDAEIYGDPAAAADWFEAAHQLMDKSFTYKRTMVVRWLHCLSRSQRTGQALGLIDRYQHIYGDSPDFFFAAGNVYLDHAMVDPSKASSLWLPKAIESWERCLQIGEKPEMEGTVAGRGSFLAAKNLFAVYSVLGDQEKADIYAQLSQHRPDNLWKS